MTDIRRDGIMECRKKTYTKKGATEKRKFETTESVDSEVRKFVNPIKPLMSEAKIIGSTGP